MKHFRIPGLPGAAFLSAIMMVMASCQSSEQLKSEQYFVTGQQVYMTHCANCHQADGKGMSNLYPPIEGSSILADKARVACIIKNGMKDTIVVNGRKFNRPMPANPKLTEIEIAEIVSFMTMKWGKDSVYTPINLVHDALEGCRPD